MRATPFLSYAVDPDGPWHGLADCAQSIEVMPGGPTGSLHLFHLVGNGVGEEDVPQLETRLGARVHSVATIHYDRVTRRWHGQAYLDEQTLQRSCLSTVLDMEGFDVPWIHLDRHEASVRLLPASDPDLFTLHARLETALRRPVSVTYLDYAEYRRWLERLHVAS